VKVNQNYNVIVSAIIALLLTVILVSNNASFHQPIKTQPKDILAERAERRKDDVTINESEKLPDFNQFKQVQQKKNAFFNFIKPLIANENSRILTDKNQLSNLQNAFTQSKKLTIYQQKQLDYLTRYYRVEKASYNEMFKQLRLNVDVIPQALVLVQAANESAWGTSRFAVEANNLFGQWCYSKGCGLVPASRSKQSKHEVRKFRHAQESVISYMRNLNTHYAYKKFRKIRSQLRQQQSPLSAVALAKGLESYSQRGSEYVSELILMIKQNKLE
jgi:Bax protein